MSSGDIETIVDTVFETIVDLVCDGQDVRLPAGRWYAKLIRKNGQVHNVKLGFTSYKAIDQGVKKRYCARFQNIIGGAK